MINLTHCILVDSSIVICWTSPFVILGVLRVVGSCDVAG